MSWATWRDRARPMVARVLEENRGKPIAEIRAALRAAYPFGTRRHWPYKVWCSEVRLQLGIVSRAWPARKGTPAHAKREASAATLDLPFGEGS